MPVLDIGIKEPYAQISKAPSDIGTMKTLINAQMYMRNAYCNRCTVILLNTRCRHDRLQDNTVLYVTRESVTS